MTQETKFGSDDHRSVNREAARSKGETYADVASKRFASGTRQRVDLNK